MPFNRCDNTPIQCDTQLTPGFYQWLDYPSHRTHPFRHHSVHWLVKLATHSTVFLKALFVHDISSNITTGALWAYGSHANIFLGRYRGKEVVIKHLRVNTRDTDLYKILRVCYKRRDNSMYSPSRFRMYAEKY